MGQISRAYTVAMSDGRQPLDMTSEEAGENFGLGFAELGKLRSYVRDGAVVLAQLLAGRRGVDRRGVAVPGQGCCQHSRAVLGRGCGDDISMALFEFGCTTTGEVGDRFGSAGLSEEAQGGGGEVVVRLHEGVAA